MADPGPAKAAEVGDSVLFDGEASSDSDGSIQSYHWDFGDGTAADGKAVIHEYEVEGTYTVTLSVTDDCGAGSEEASATVEVTDPDPCAGNQPPVADAGADQTGETGQSLMFDGGASWDPDGLDLSYAWNFGDGQTGSGATVIHVYESEGEYTVTLTVTDGCVSSSEAAIVTVNGSDPAPLAADFKVYRLVSVDPVDGTEEWVEIDLENEEIELGLRVKFDGRGSTGPVAHWNWSFMDSTGDSGETVVHTYDEPGDYDVRLKVFNEAWTEWDTITKTIHVDERMRLLSRMPTGAGLRPKSFTLLGSELWTLTIMANLGVADISNPYDLPPLELVPTEDLSRAMQIAGSNGRLFVAKGRDGVDIYRAERNNFGLLGQLSVTDLGALAALNVASVGDTLYVATQSPDQILVYDVSALDSTSNPRTPTLVAPLPIQGRLSGMWQSDEEALLVLDSRELTLTIVDIRKPNTPRIVTVISLDTSFVGQVGAVQGYIAADTAEGVALWELMVPNDPDRPLEIGAKQILVPDRGFPLGFTRDRLYKHHRGFDDSVWKYNIVGPTKYFMDGAVPSGGRLYGGFLFDPDGPPGPQSPVLIIGIACCGFEAISL